MSKRIHWIMETIDFRISNDKENFVECKKKKQQSWN